MIDLGPVLLLRPFWLLAVPAALVAAALMARRLEGLSRWRTVIDPHLLPVLRRRGFVDEAARDPGPWLVGAAAALVALGLSGPATRNSEAPAFRNLDVIMILMDLSPSVTEGGGLDDAQAAVSHLLDRHGARPVALALFSGESFLVGVPTEETEGLQTAVAVLDAGTIPVAGSRPDRAFSLARETLSDATAERADVVLVSDGGGLGPEALNEVRLLHGAGARVSAIQVEPDAAPYGMTPPDPGALAAVAEAGGGILVPATDPRALVESLAAQQGVTESELRRSAVLFTDHGRWMVGLACLGLLSLFRRRSGA